MTLGFRRFHENRSKIPVGQRAGRVLAIRLDPIREGFPFVTKTASQVGDLYEAV